MTVRRRACRALAIVFLALAVIWQSGLCAAQDKLPLSEDNWQSRIEAERVKVVNAGQTSQIDTGAQIGRMLEGLAYCLALFLAGFHLYKRFHDRAQASSTRNLKIIESVMLGPKTFLHLVEVNNRHILVGSGQQVVSIAAVEKEIDSDGGEFCAEFQREAIAANNQRSREQLC